MKQIILIVAAVSAATLTMPAGAQSVAAFITNPTFQGPRPARCMSTLEMQRCAAADLRVADAQMTARYKAVSAGLSQATRKTLLSEQRTWLKSRDRDCLAKGGGGGSIATLNVARCWVNATKARTVALDARSSRSSIGRVLPVSAFVGRWRGGEGTYMKIARRGSKLVIDNQWGLDEDMHGVFTGTLTSEGLRFRRNGLAETVKPSVGDRINRSALRGKKDCLIVSVDEGYCRY